MFFNHLFFLLTLLPPLAEPIPTTLTNHGDTRVDNYYWLREKNNPNVEAYLKAENEYADHYMAPTKELQKKVYEEFLARLPKEDSSVPEQHKNFYYSSLFPKEKPYPLHLRNNEIYFDENEYADGKEFFSLGVLCVSPDQKILGYTVDTEGNERYSLHFKNLETKEELKDVIVQVSDLIFANDNKTVFYTTLDSTNRSYRLYRHTLGSSEETLLYEEKDPSYSIGINKSHDEKVLFFTLQSLLTSTTFFLNADTPFGTFCEVLPKKEGVEYKVEHRNGKYYILTNDNAPNFKVVVDCETLIPEREDVAIDSFEIFEKYLALFEMKGGLPQIEIYQFETGQTCTFKMEEPVYTLSEGGHTEFDSSILRFRYSSFLTPTSIYDFDMEKKTFTLRKKEDVGPFNACNYVEKRVFATARDGTQIPLSIVYKKGMKHPGVFLKGYGAYGVNYPVRFSRALLSLLDRGVIYAVAHVRGGGEYGRKWYDGGRVCQKKNSFTDFIAAAEFLKNNGYGPLVISGRSAGGLLMGAVLTMRPDLFKGVIAEVPFLDVVTTMEDPSIPLTTFEYKEWGDPKKREEYFYMKSYSPYDNIQKRAYPPLLLLGGLNDTRVGYFEPAKFAAKMRVNKTDTSVLLLKTLGSGHFGASDRFNTLEEEAFVYAFILSLLNT